jgi:DNA-binding beta-propeller fold protein YncE
MNIQVRFMPGRVRSGFFGGSGPGAARGAWAPARRVAVVLAVVVCGVLALGAGSALGALSFPLDGQLAPAGGTFGGVYPSGVAVDDANGDTYVADHNTGEVFVFETASGVQLAGLDGSSTPAGSFGGSYGGIGVAANNGTGAVYVLDSTDGVVDVFEANGEYHCQITGSSTLSASECNAGGSATPAGGFDRPSGIAVDQATGEVYVGDARNGVIDIFSLGGAYLRQISLASIELGTDGGVGRSIAVDDHNGDVYLSDFNPAVVYVFSAATGEYLSTWTGANTPGGSFGERATLNIAADNASGDVYVSESTSPESGVFLVDVFESSGEYVGSQFGQPFVVPFSVAVDQASGRVNVSNATGARDVVDVFGPGLVIPDVRTGAAGEVLSHSATLSGAVNPDGVEVTDCHFDYVSEASYEASAADPYTAGGTVPCEETVGSGSGEVAVQADVHGLEVGTSYHFRLQAANANGVRAGGDVTFQTPPPPVVTGASAVNLTGTSVDLDAQVNPEGLDTTYHFEYGTSTAYGTSVPVPDADIGAGTAAVPVTTHVSGLTVDTAYHWRVIATNASGATTGVDHVFIYDTAGRGVLPDGRAYEMVSPSQKDGALVNGGLAGLAARVDVGEDGSRVIVGNIQCLAGAVSCPTNRMDRLGGVEEFSRAGGGWVASSLEPAARAGTEVSMSTWVSYSADAGTALFTIPTSPFGEDDFYARQPDGSFSDIGPLTSPSEGPTFINHPTSFFDGAVAATTDFSHIVYQLFASGAQEGTTFEHLAGGEGGFLVGVSGGLGSTDQISGCGTTLGVRSTSGAASQNAMSGDGRIVYFTSWARNGFSNCAGSALAPVVDELFARVDGGEAGAHTVAVSQPGALLPAPASLGCTTAVCIENTSDSGRFRGARFVAGSADGSRAFFLSEQQLVDGASEDLGNNLYLYDFAAPAGHSLVDVSAGDTSGGGPRVSGVSAVSSDGSHVYFVAGGVLSSVANGRGQVAREGAANLYVFERDAAYPDGHVAFVAAASPGGGANVSPDGRFLVFTSGEDLTPDDTRTGGAQQVFRYDAQSGELVRISIGEGGFNDNGNAGVGDASIVEGNPSALVAGVERTDPTMSHDGAFVFFMSPVALTPGALNDVQVGVVPSSGAPEYAQNVYEYHDGGVYLISDGRDTTADVSATCESMLRPLLSSVCLIGVDGSGANVFFSTDDRLVAGDTDTSVDIYDARVCTAGDPCAAPAVVVSPCVGEGCRGVPEGAPSLLAPASASFAGAGNQVVAAPVVKAKKKAKAKKPRKAARTRRAHGRKRGRGARVSGKRVKRGRR